MGEPLYLLAKALALPPGLQCGAALLGLCCLPRWRRLGLALLVLSTFSLWLCATPWFAAWLAAPLERAAPAVPAQVAAFGAEAIVVLGGGGYERAPEFGGQDEVNRLTLERLRHAARLQRVTGLDLAVTGGITGTRSLPEAVTMAVALGADFRVPVRWVESTSRTTAENARHAARDFPFRRIVLVTHAVHMPRAVRAFEAAGFTVLPAPLGFISGRGAADTWAWTDFQPDMKAFADTQYAVYEWLGALWYRLRGWS